MKLLSRAYQLLKEKTENKDSKTNLITFLEKLKDLEGQLWGITFNQIKNDEDEVLENTNHLIYLITNHSEQTLISLLKKKETIIFINELKQIRLDFLQLKKQIEQKNRLKNLITEFSIKCIDITDLEKLGIIFLHEKQLFEVLEKQQEEFQAFFDEIEELRIKKHDDDTVEYFLAALKRIRNILGGHIDNHSLWKEERIGYSNTSNIIHSLIDEVKNT
jgi:hypothetical protein